MAVVFIILHWDHINSKSVLNFNSTIPFLFQIVSNLDSLTYKNRTLKNVGTSTARDGGDTMGTNTAKGIDRDGDSDPD